MHERGEGVAEELDRLARGSDDGVEDLEPRREALDRARRPVHVDDEVAQRVAGTGQALGEHIGQRAGMVANVVTYGAALANTSPMCRSLKSCARRWIEATTGPANTFPPAKNSSMTSRPALFAAAMTAGSLNEDTMPPAIRRPTPDPARAPPRIAPMAGAAAATAATMPPTRIGPKPGVDSPPLSAPP